MKNDELYHYGTRGMKWGIRRYQNKDGSLTPAGKKRYNAEMSKLKAEEKVLKNRQKTQAKFDKLDQKRKEIDDLKKGKISSTSSSSETKPKGKSIKDMSDDELQAYINRSNLEKQYKQAVRDQNPEKVSKGRQFVMDVLEQSGKNVATQVATYAMGKAANKVLEGIFHEPNAINPKKGQKDK